MTYYLCLFFLILVEGVVLLRNKNSKSAKLFYFLVWVEITLMAGLRSVNVARDTFHYYSMFNYISRMPDLTYLNTHMETGFLYFNKLLSYICKSPQFLFFVVGGFYNYVFLRFISKYSPWPLISVLIFFSAVPLGSYVFGMSFLRQAMAIGFFVLGIEALLKNNKKYFILCVFLGILFHKSAVICFAMLLLLYVPITFNAVILSICFTIIFMIIFPIILPHLPFGLGNYSGYMYWDVAEVSKLTAAFKAVTQLFIMGSLLYVFLPRKDLSKISKIFIWISILAFICELAAIRVLFMNRILYFTSLNCIIVPYILANIRNKKDFLIFAFGFFMIFMLNNTDFWMRRAEREHLLQYETFWSNPQGITRWNLYY